MEPENDRPELEIIDTVPGSPEPRDLFEPHMPGVDVFSDMDALFAWARGQSAAAGEGRPVVILTPGRMVMRVPTPPPGTLPESMEQGPRSLLPGDRPLNVSVVAYTRLQALMEDEKKVKCIPFLGHLIGFAYVGHSVVVFEGHPTAFEAGVRNADVLLIDSAMLPFLQEDWASVAFRVMSDGGRILVHDREHYQLLPIARTTAPPGWRYAEPDGEGSYANCLLTTLAQSTRRTAEILAGAPLPDLGRIATDPEQLEWASTLPFRYDRLNAEQVIAILLRAARPQRVGLFRRALVLNAKLVTKGAPRDVSFQLTHGRTAGGREHLRIERM